MKVRGLTGALTASRVLWVCDLRNFCDLELQTRKDKASTDALTHGVRHVGRAVRALDEATSFFCGTVGFEEAGRNDAYPAVCVSDGTVTLTLWRVAEP